jgi:protein involved in polysaccharide export with SLBB domain
LRTSGNPIYLQDGDLLFVPKRPSHVSVIGSVYSQVSTDFNPRKTVADYLSDAGGLDRVADNRNIYLVLPNGQSQPLANDTDTTTLVPPGAVIVVPPKTDKLTALGLTEVISKILGNIATSLLAINAVR